MFKTKEQYFAYLQMRAALMMQFEVLYAAQRQHGTRPEMLDLFTEAAVGVARAMIHERGLNAKPMDEERLQRLEDVSILQANMTRKMTKDTMVQTARDLAKEELTRYGCEAILPEVLEAFDKGTPQSVNTKDKIVQAGGLFGKKKNEDIIH